MLLTWITFLPLIGVAAITLVPKAQEQVARWVALAIAAADLVLVGIMVVGFNTDGGMQFEQKVSWISQLGINYHMAVDGISMPLVALSSLLTLLAIIASWHTSDRPKLFFAMLLLLEVGMNGVFMALDFILFYLFWELVLVPMYFIIAQWGGANRAYAAIKFFIYTLLGSVFMLVAIVVLYLKTGSFNMVELVGLARELPAGMQWWLFLLFFLGFAVKVPVFPLHTWLPDAHTEAPTAGSVLLAGVLLKMGTYGFIRVSLPMLPDAFRQWQWALAVLAVVSIAYGGAVAFAQTDLKKLVAYSSVAHMGFAMLGIASGTVVGINGAMAVNVSHGLVTGMLFLMVGMIYDRTHTRQIADLSGIFGRMPVLGGLLAFASIASLGLPGLSGFVGEFLSLAGAYEAVVAGSPLGLWMVILAAFGILLGAAYMLWMLQRVAMGTPSEVVATCDDVSARELVTVAPLVVFTLIIGLYWSALLDYVDPAVVALVEVLGG